MDQIKKAFKALAAAAVTLTTMVLYFLLRREKEKTHALEVKGARDMATERAQDSKDGLAELQNGVDDAEKIRLERGKALDDLLSRRPKPPSR